MTTVAIFGNIEKEWERLQSNGGCGIRWLITTDYTGHHQQKCATKLRRRRRKRERAIAHDRSRSEIRSLIINLSLARSAIASEIKIIIIILMISSLIDDRFARWLLDNHNNCGSVVDASSWMRVGGDSGRDEECESYTVIVKSAIDHLYFIPHLMCIFPPHKSQSIN